MGKKAVFIDGNNLYFGMRQRGVLPGGHIDMLRLVLETVGPVDIKRYYSSLPEGETPHRGFLKALAHMGFHITLGYLSEGRGGREKGTDVALAVDLVLLKGGGLYEEAHLFSGDGDLVPAVRAVQALGGRVVVWSFQEYLALPLAQAADEVHLLDGLDWEALRYRKPKRGVSVG